MRELHIRPSPYLIRRLRFAATAESVTIGRYAKKILERWSLDETRVSLAEVDDETGPFHAYRFPVCDQAHQNLRRLAGQLDISVSSLSIRVLHTYTPHEAELLAQALSSSGGSGSSSSQPTEE